jgi:hypothetical protein
MTDYTEACLDNLAYNVHENAKWLIGRGISPEAVTVGRTFLDAFLAAGVSLCILSSPHYLNIYLLNERESWSGATIQIHKRMANS